MGETKTSNNNGGELYRQSVTSIRESSNNNHIVMRRQDRSSREVFWNFVLLSSLFSTNHAAAVSCLSLASARLGSDIGSWQSGTLYFSYTVSALLGVTYVTKSVGSRNGMALGMAMYCVYVLSFIVSIEVGKGLNLAVAIFGGLLGGTAAGIMWTSQGTYFALTSEKYQEALSYDYDYDMGASSTNEDLDSSIHDQNVNLLTELEDITSKLGGLFAMILLAGEVIWRLFSTIAVDYFDWSWKIVFGVYLSISIMATASMIYVHDYEEDIYNNNDVQQQSKSYAMENMAVVGRMFINDRKMKYMIPLCAVFGFSSSFVLSFVNGEALKLSILKDEKSAYVGLFSSITSGVAGIMSFIFGYGYKYFGKGLVLTLGSLSFFMLSLIFMIIRDPSQWNWAFFLSVYSLQGLGRATYEGALRSRFADFFGYEKPGAFANFVFYNGISSTIGFFINIYARCSHTSVYCLTYQNHTIHNVLVLEVIIMIFAVLSVLGYYRAVILYREEKDNGSTRYQQDSSQQMDKNIVENDDASNTSLLL